MYLLGLVARQVSIRNKDNVLKAFHKKLGESLIYVYILRVFCFCVIIESDF
jgi:fucose 4-O-acetylase-like acetyltransferase